MLKRIRDEAEMYAPVGRWLHALLQAKHPKWKVETANTSGVALYRWLEQTDYTRFFPEYLGYDIRVDVTGIAIKGKIACVAFVECKKNALSLGDISQLLGYCRVAQPEFAFAISPEGIGTHVSYLLQTYGRYDVLEYNAKNRIMVGRWNADRGEIDADSFLPPGEFVLKSD